MMVDVTHAMSPRTTEHMLVLTTWHVSASSGAVGGRHRSSVLASREGNGHIFQGGAGR